MPIHGMSTAVACLVSSCFSAWQPSQPLRPPPQQQTGSPAEAPSGHDTRATPGTQDGAMPPVIDRNTDAKTKGTSWIVCTARTLGGILDYLRRTCASRAENYKQGVSGVDPVQNTGAYHNVNLKTFHEPVLQLATHVLQSVKATSDIARGLPQKIAIFMLPAYTKLIGMAFSYSVNTHRLRRI